MPPEFEFLRKKELAAGLYNPGVFTPPPPLPWTIVKLALDTSKNTFPTDSTLTRPTVVETLGTEIVWLPSFGALVARTIGNVLPPSVERVMLTFAQLTGAVEVPATFHVTVSVVPPVQTSGVFGEVTTNGPAVDVTLRTIASEFTPPPAARLSRAVTLKFIVRVVVGNNSPIAEMLFRISESFGNVREGFVTALNERNNGRVPSSAIGGEGFPTSNCSHEYVSASPSGSLPLAVKVNGVPAGIVKSGPAEIEGGLLPVAVAAAHTPPPAA